MKRLFDFVIALIALCFFSPLLLILYGVIRCRIGSPVFFTQDRPGYKGHIFKMYKFRTMTNARDGNGNLLPDAQRMTSIGHFLRSTSLDELPELWNVLKGDMSLVGPRPLLVQYLSRYTPEQARRHEVKPGITGWAQINGRNAISWEEKFKLDVWYVDHCSLVLDIKILWQTILKVIKKDGITAQEHVTMPEFMGANITS